MPGKPAIKDAIAAWSLLLGEEWVRLDAATLAACETATFETTQSVSAILFPANVEQVQECVRIANRYKVPLSPISRGKNWGYGSRVPATDGAVVLSLERMDAIVEHNETLAYITVEPGVTFQQVYEFLKENGSNLTPPAIGSTPGASLIGNAVERGIGKGVYGDRFGFSCNMEVVLPTGECVRTGFGNIRGAHSQHVNRWGVGPSLDGMFSQSNFGIVTRMTFWLTQKPAHFQVFFYTVKDQAQLERAIDALRQLRLEGTLTATATLSNDYRVLAMKQQFPWAEAAPLPSRYVEAWRKRAIAGGAWVGDDAIMAPTKAQGKARARRVRQVLGKVVDKLVMIDNRTARAFGLLHKPVLRLTGINLRELAFFFYNSFYLGIPMDKQLAICYWRKKTPPPAQMDMDRDRCGVIWCSPSIPFEGRHVARVLEIMRPIYYKYEFEPNMGLNMMSERNIACTSAIIYDRDTPGEDARAMLCYKEMVRVLAYEGYVPYRLGVQSMGAMVSDSPDYAALIGRLKASLDPNGVLSPGRYGVVANVNGEAEKVEELELA